MTLHFNIVKYSTYIYIYILYIHIYYIYTYSILFEFSSLPISGRPVVGSVKPHVWFAFAKKHGEGVNIILICCTQVCHVENCRHANQSLQQLRNGDGILSRAFSSVPQCPPVSQSSSSGVTFYIIYTHVLSSTCYIVYGKVDEEQSCTGSIEILSLSKDEMSVLLRKGREDLSDAELEVLWDDMNHDGDEAARAQRAQRALHHCTSLHI